MPDSDEEDLTEEEKALRKEKAEKIKRILTQQRYVYVQETDSVAPFSYCNTQKSFFLKNSLPETSLLIV